MAKRQARDAGIGIAGQSHANVDSLNKEAAIAALDAAKNNDFKFFTAQSDNTRVREHAHRTLDEGKIYLALQYIPPSLQALVLVLDNIKKVSQVLCADCNAGSLVTAQRMAERHVTYVAGRE